MGKCGRNDPCPCGSGKKFKKCCEARSAMSFKAEKIASQASSSVAKVHGLRGLLHTPLLKGAEEKKKEET